MACLRWVLIAFSLVLAFGCSGGSSSSSDGTTSQGVTLSTTLELTSDSETAGAVSLAMRSAAVTAATVTLTLPDGTTYTMSDNGSGEYSCTVSDFPTGSPFVIEAHAGDLILKNFFESLPDSGDAVDLGVTDPDTTLLTDLIAAFAGALDENHNTPTAAHLLNALKDASLQIDLISLRSQVEDENDATFEQVRSTYRTVLSENNMNGGQSSSDLIAEAGTFETVVTDIESGGILPPAAGSDSESAKLLVAGVYQAYFEGDLEALAAAMGGEGFLWEGLDGEAWLLGAQMEDEFGSATDMVFSQVADLSVAEAGPEPDSWWVHPGAEITFTADGVDRLIRLNNKKSFGEISPLLVKKDEEGRFAFYGDQKKSWAGGDLVMSYRMNSQECSFVAEEPTCDVVEGSQSSIELGIYNEETTQHPVQAATLTSSAFAEAFSLRHSPFDDSNERDVWITYKHNGTLSENVWYPLTEETWESAPITWTSPFGGASLTLDIEYEDGSSETRQFKVPPLEEVISADIQPPVFHADGTTTLEWTDISGQLPGGAGFGELRVNIIDDVFGQWIELLEFWNLDPAVNSLTIPAGTLENGKVYLIEVRFKDLYGREFRTLRYFRMAEEQAAPTEEFTTELLDAAPTFYVRYEDAEGSVQETISLSGTGGAYNVDVLVQEFDAGGALTFSETERLDGITLETDGTLKAIHPEGATIITLLQQTESFLDVRGEENGDTWEDRWYLSPPSGWITP